jgi:hypothetical protein
MLHPSRIPAPPRLAPIVLACLCLTVGPAAMATTYLVEGHAFESSETLHEQTLVLNGASGSNILSAKATVVGFYLPEKKTTVEGVTQLKGSKRIRLIALRDITSKDLGTVLMDRIRQNATPDEKIENIMQIAQVGMVFSAAPQLAKGDVATIDWVPARQHTEFRINGKLIGEPVVGEAFYPMFMKVWIGPRTRPATRNNLLGTGESLTVAGQ